MCGIAGELSFNSIVNSSVIQRMTGAIIHRGPDDEGVYCNGKIGLGHRRLSIIDVSYSGHQPMWSRDQSMVIVFNGEVYNYKEIRSDLENKGYDFQGESDTEVVIHAIHYWGIDVAIKYFIGMFAFALWDSRDDSLLLVRDRLGVKPLYYQKTLERIIFGSELKALYAHPDFEKKFSPKGLGQFFCTGYTLGDTTVFNDTHKLLAGHYLRITNNVDYTLTQYWSLKYFKRGDYNGTYKQAQERLKELCDSAFQYRTVSDVPVGVFLSGGVDSTYLSYFLKKRLHNNFKHITIGFNSEAYNEAPAATKIADDLNLQHSIKYIDAEEARKALYDFIEIWDEPFGDTSGIPTSILCEYARKEVKVALSADGGDEIFCGYESYRTYSSLFYLLQKFPLMIRKIAVRVMRLLPYKYIISAILSTKNSTRWNPQAIARYEKLLDIMEVDNERQLIRVMNEKGWSADRVSQLLRIKVNDIFNNTVFESRSKESMGSTVDHMMRTDLSAFLGDDILTKVDRASMAASLECREPFLDHRIVEFVFSLPIEYLYKGGVHKRILKKVIQPFVSSSVLRSPKRGFSIPLYDWLRGPWKELVYEYLSPEKIRRVGVLNESEVMKELDNFYKYNGGRAEKIMLMLNFQMWAERWL